MDWAANITAVSLLVTALASLLNVYLSRRIEKNTNSMREQMVTSAKTEGLAEGRANQKADDAAATLS